MIRGIDVHTGQAVELECRDGRITRRQLIPLTEDLPCLSVGWFDLQVNGWAGIDFNTDTISLADAEKLVRLLAKSGTTRFLPTVITASPEKIIERVAKIAEYCDTSPTVRRAVVGIHVEGPFIAEADGPRGAHDRQFVRDPSVAELDEWIEASGNRVRMVTLAPERPGAIEFIRALGERRIIAALGHTACSGEDVEAAVEAGARFSTHLGNGLSNQIHRHNNPVWPQLAADSLVTGLIADGFHLPDSLLKVMAAAKGVFRVILVSDVTAPGGLRAGTHTWSGMEVTVSDTGRISLAGTPYLAGAGHLLDRGIAVFLRATGLTLDKAITTVTANPHALLALPKTWSSLNVGSPGDIVSFRVRPDSDSASIEAVYIEGELV
ncbi:MAG: N-acetylglucosamine-6-phosphate deacetylase [Spirochaetales bacterium]|nr:MAG: N-acetylglucosamine-6-phosphate deacetylase [Spirochaetales bacterium]